MTRRNGYVLEQLLSPLAVETSAAHEELVALAPGCITRHHAHHYRGFANTQWRLFEKPDELKPLLTDLDAAADATDLPDRPTAQPALHDLIVRLRLGHE